MALVAALGVTACSFGGTSAGDDVRFTGSGVVRIVPEDQRSAEPVVVTGAGVDDSTLSTKQFAGQPMVLSYWYSYCAPCRTEAPDLATAYRRLSVRHVAFLGINIRDNEAAARTFMQTFRVPYATIFDDSGRAALATGVSVAAVPSTVVLDAQHRLAAQVTGPVDAATLTQLVDQVTG